MSQLRGFIDNTGDVYLHAGDMERIVREKAELAAGGARVMRSLLYETTPHDPWTFAAAPLVLVSVALVACYVPARRAARIEPIVALRNE